MFSTADKAEARNRLQGVCSIAQQLFSDRCSDKFPQTSQEAKDLIEKCFMVAKEVEDFLFEQFKPFI